MTESADSIAQRIQLRRSKGWRLPPNTVKVDRSTRWGNPWRVGRVACGCPIGAACEHNRHHCDTMRQAVAAFAAMPRDAAALAEIRVALGGKNLACWCPLDAPCHADVLLRLANPARG